MFVREPIAGAVKTRLVPALGRDAAAALYRAFIDDMCARLAPRLPLVLAYGADAEPAARGRFITSVARRHRLRVIAQGDGDLGTRMRRVATVALASASSVVIVGSDLPTLPIAHVSAALDLLAPRRPGRRGGAAPIVLGPSLDGGYYLLGLRAPLPDVFCRMPWSTDRVLARTLARLRRARVAPAFVPPWYDVDTPTDLALLARHLDVLRVVGDDPCPRTRVVLARLRRSSGHASTRSSIVSVRDRARRGRNGRLLRTSARSLE